MAIGRLVEAGRGRGYMNVCLRHLISGWSSNRHINWKRFPETLTVQQTLLFW